MTPAQICIDANIVVRFVADPTDQSVATLWDGWDREGVTPAAPSLIFYEVTNALYRYRKMDWLSPEAVEEALSAALALPIDVRAEARLFPAALRLASRFGLPAAYDGHYLALAESLSADLWTTDRRLFNSVKAGFPKIRLAGG